MGFERLAEMIARKENPSVMGLDPLLGYVPEMIIKKNISLYGKTPKAAGEAIFEFNKGLIDSAADLIPAVKPQSAFYEKYGQEGLYALDRTIAYAKDAGLYVILDVKRNDIGSTAEAYSDAYIGETDIFGENIAFGRSDCITVNGYLGSDGILPFIKNCERYGKAIFVLVKTSNPSSGELQDCDCGGKPVYYKMAEMTDSWNRGCGVKSPYGCCGAVVGATYPQQLTDLRRDFPNLFFLIPGYGAQGGKADDIKGAFGKDGRRAIVNSSRGLMCAYMQKKDPDNFKIHTREAVIKMKDELNNISNVKY